MPRTQRCRLGQGSARTPEEGRGVQAARTETRAGLWGGRLSVHWSGRGLDASQQHHGCPRRTHSPWRRRLLRVGVPLRLRSAPSKETAPSPERSTSAERHVSPIPVGSEAARHGAGPGVGREPLPLPATRAGRPPGHRPPRPHLPASIGDRGGLLGRGRGARRDWERAAAQTGRARARGKACFDYGGRSAVG